MFFVNFIDSFECDLSAFFGGGSAPCLCEIWSFLSACIWIWIHAVYLMPSLTHIYTYTFLAWLYIFRVWIDQRKIMQNNFFSVQYSTNDKWKFLCHWKWFSHIIFRLHFLPQRKKQKFQEDKTRWVLNM